MGKTIRLFIAVICSFALALTSTAAYTKKPTSRGSASQGVRGDSERPGRKSASGQDGGNTGAPACKLCTDPCEVKRQIEKGLIKVSDQRGKRIEKIWVIDARPGIISPCGDKDTYYVTSPRTRVYIINMNPFAFDYEITKTEDNVPETAQIAFLKLLGTPISDAIGSQGEAPGKATSGTQVLTKDEDNPCKDMIENATTYLNEVDKVNGEDFDSRIRKLDVEYQKFQTAYEGTREAYVSLLDRWATCEQLCVYMASFKKNYAPLRDKYAFENVAVSVLREYDRLFDNFKQAFPHIEGCVGPKGMALQERLAKMRRKVEILKDKLTVLCNNVFKADNRAKLDAMDEAIDTVLKHPDILLMQTFDVGGYPDATRVKVTVEPKPKQLTATFTQVEGKGPQPCDEAGAGGGGQGGQGGKGGDGKGDDQPVVSAKPTPTP